MFERNSLEMQYMLSRKMPQVLAAAASAWPSQPQADESAAPARERSAVSLPAPLAAPPFASVPSELHADHSVPVDSSQATEVPPSPSVAMQCLASPPPDALPRESVAGPAIAINVPSASAAVSPNQVPADLTEILDVLPPPQKKAMDCLLDGRSVSDAARSAGVNRCTVHRWLSSDSMFKAAYNGWHQQMRETAHNRLAMLADKATDAVERALDEGNAKTAMTLLRGMGLLPGPDRRRAEREENSRRSDTV